ncbi:glycoside hydrolase [Basidiobolus meristosporus CBS 931.73]|uniref:Chitinase domain-containing protein 1 n=1 Tax=Basidiobolus meristosporus CBS 931.73 TaxID=1314790 RepID=A0A1Y1Y734_9FUNG|nr:glycoside hydrolase [Basidiobolus meristosporus CBS 931.73]|eukprot:ORX93705.1 glycoside hydrolase [Basidiobolus meristosporus CBS 931.73]
MLAVGNLSESYGHRGFYPTPGNPPTTFHAWMFYGAPAQNAAQTYKRYTIDVLRTQYFNLLDDGNLQLVYEDSSDLYNTQNAYSERNIAELKRFSKEQLVTISGHISGMRQAFSKLSTNSTHIIQTLVDFVNDHRLTGIDIDFENYNQWTSKDYSDYKSFVTSLGKRLHESNKKLAICGPMWTSEEPPFQWKYEDFVNLPIDYVTPMIYDYQWDYGGGAPICPLEWLRKWTLKMKRIFHSDQLVIGLPSYGYTAKRGKYNIRNLTLQQIKRLDGYHGGRRDNSSAEVFKFVGDTVYVSIDRKAINAKRRVVESLGVRQISVWHLGGNDWF